MFRTRELSGLRMAGVTVVLCFSVAARGQNAPKFIPEPELPHSAEQTARATGLLTLFDRLKALNAQNSPANIYETMLVRQQILQEILSASLQLDATMGQIDEEIASTRELENYLQSKRDQRLDLLNLVSIAIGGTAGTASSALGLTTHDVAASVTGIVAGSATAVISLVGFKLRNGKKELLMMPSNMLSELFDGPSADDNVYPPAVVAFMSSPAPDDPEGLSREARLIKTWVEIGRIPPPNTAKGTEKIAHVTSMPSETVKQAIADLDDRQAMLYDFRSRLTYMKRDLASLLGTVSKDVALPTNAPQPVR